MQEQRQRITPDAKQVKTARGLLDRVPPLSYDWGSTQGRAFLAYIERLGDCGVPVSWIAEPLGLDPARLYATLTRYRNQVPA